MAPKPSADRKPPTDHPKCGTQPGYQRHRKNGEVACARCKRAHADYQKEYYRARQRKPTRTAPPTAKSTAVSRSKGTTPMVGSPKVDRPKVDVVQPVQEIAEDLPQPPAYLRAKGTAMWKDVVRAYDLTPAALVLLGEACRTADRLERIAAALSSRSSLWFELEPALEDAGLDGKEDWNVVVNGMIGEARQLQTALRQTLSQLGVVGVEASTAGQPMSVLDQLAERREQRKRKMEQEA